MWKGKATAMARRALHTGAFTKADKTKAQWWPVHVGAALSLLLLAELDRQRKQHESSSSLEDDRTTSGWNNNNHRWMLPVFPATTNMTTACEAKMKPGGPKVRGSANMRRFQTLRKMDEDSSKDSLESRYKVNWKAPLGEGSFGAVYVGIDQLTGEKVAVKKISKKYTNDDEFYREMNALLHLRRAGGHPGICSLREHFNERGHYYLILDLVSGGEMFDHLVEQGAYSEADAARLIREVASSLYFIHGLSLTHGDLKPENLMLSSKNPTDAVIKLIDFGCSQVENDEDRKSSEDPTANNIAGKTLAYCPPEVLKAGSDGKYTMNPSMDMWALGVILYIMLTGMHPYDIRGQASDEEVAKHIVSGDPPPLRNSPITAHLSESSIDLIERLMDPNPKTRMDATTLLQHPWVKGETALTSKMELAGKKLSMYHVYKSGIERKVFEKLVTGSDDINNSSKRTSLIEQSFRWFDPEHKGHIDLLDLQEVKTGVPLKEFAEADAAPLSLSGFSELLAEHMQNRYFPKGHIVYREGEIGNKMFFISSGTITVSTKTGFTVQRGPGDFFGEGALLSPKKVRSATIHCNTPVHAMEVSREYFDQYLAKSDSALYLFLREKDIIRKKNRAKMILRLESSLKERELQFGETLFETDDTTDSMFLMENGLVDVLVDGKKVLTVTPGNLFGENSALTRRARSATALCATEDGCTVFEMEGRNFRRLMRRAPDIKASLENMMMRRDFKKAVVMRLNKEFPYTNPREAFDAVKTDTSQPNHLTKEEIGALMREFSPSFSDKEVAALIRTMDLNYSGTVSFDEFKKVFIADVKGSASK